MNILLLNLPVHIPTVMPYSLAMMNCILRSSINETITMIDLNSFFHLNKFPEHYRSKGYDYFKALDKFEAASRSHYQNLSRAAREGRKPEGYDLLIKRILAEKPDVVCISFTYNSQMYFADSLVKELNFKKIKVIVGGPADYSKLKDVVRLENYSKLIDHLETLGAKRFVKMKNAIIDFSDFNKKEYFTNDVVYPLRTAISCPYKQCAFCTHHGNLPYHMMDLSAIKDAILVNKMKKVCFIDDDFPIVRIKELAKLLEPLRVEWWCQLRPVKELIPLFHMLYDSGLRSVAWGVESGSQKVLDLMEKGTKVEDVMDVLKASNEIGIKNMTYIMFGYPGETEAEFMKTIEFLEKNAKSIELVSLSVFGLQRGSRIYDNPEEFGVKKVEEIDRTLYGEKITYEPKEGLTQLQAKELKLKMKGRINKVNKVPKVLNSCKEQILNFD